LIIDLAFRPRGAVSSAQAKAADAALNMACGKAVAFLDSGDNLSTVQPNDTRRAERAWIRYRDAFMAFARAAAPAAAPEAVATRLTQERIKKSQDLAS